MKTKIRSVLIGLAITAGSWSSLQAADSTSPPGDDKKSEVGPVGKTPASGHVLILENGRTLEGDIEREGSQYRVRRSIGETWVPGDKVMRLCASLDEAYDYLRRQANLRDPDERMRLARWCEQHDLHDQALVEVAAAVELRPHNAEYRRLLQSLQRTAAEGRESAKAQGAIKSTNKNEPPLVDLTAGSVSQFITRVQPVLMNTCATCHGPAHAGPFQLERVTDNGVVNRRATQHNLAHVLAQINPDNITASPLLIKAVSLHGEATQPPIKNRDAQAFHRLENWVKQTLENNPQLRERSESASSPAELKKDLKKAEDSTDDPPLTTHHSPITRSTDFAVSQPAPAKPTTPVDPFDPLIFNRQAHPEKQ
jgi:hypothetical protein